MKRNLFWILSVIISLLTMEACFAATFLSVQKPHFQVIPLGTSGGELEDNLSSYLVSPYKANDWITLDAGTLCAELDKIQFRQPIRAYLISHAHLDHISGLVICSTQEKNNKEIFGIDSTINNMRDHIFNWKIWPNFADEGNKPLLKKYHYHRLKIGDTVAIANTNMTVKPFLLSHGNGYFSTAFLIEANNYYLLYFGDTGADQVEYSQNIRKVWQYVAPLIQQKKLTAIFIEVSYPDPRPKNLLFGHLNPYWLLQELHALAKLVNSRQPAIGLKDLNVVITHVKQSSKNDKVSNIILKQLKQKNDLGVKFIIPKQGELMEF